MSYTDVFGGSLIFPSQLSYLAITTAVDVTLQWPTEQQIEGTNVVADFLDITTTAASLNIDMPDARNTSTGNKTTVNNVGSNTFTVRDNTGGTIQSVAPGEQWVIVLTDNSTQAGTWSTFQLGAQVAVASASALAGAGIKAIGVLLNQQIDSDVEASTPFSAVDGDRAKCLVYTAGAGTCNLPSPGTVGNDWFFMLRNSGSGTLNVVPPSGVIDGSASLNLQTNDSCFIFTDGTDFFTVGLSTGSTIAFDFVSIAVPGSGDFVLSGANLDRISYRFTGALTGNRRIVVPNTTQQYWCDNQTSGSFTLEIDTAAGAGIFVPQGQSLIVYCDGTDVINATSSTSVAFPITIGQGGTGATTVGGAQTNLQVPPDSRLINSGAGLAGGGDLTADRTLILDINSANTTPSPASGDFLAFEDIDDNLTYKDTIANVVAAAGGVMISGTPVNNQIAVWTAADTIEGDANFLFSGGASGVLSVPNLGGSVGSPTEISITTFDETDDGLVLEDGMRLTFEDRAFANDVYLRNEGVGGGSGTLTLRTDSSANLVLAGPGLQLNDSGLTNPVGLTQFSSPSRLNVSQAARLQGSLYLMDQTAADTDIAANGQLWSRDKTPSQLMFTDDAGNDHQASRRIQVMTADDTATSDTTFSAISGLSPIDLEPARRYRAVFTGEYNQNVGNIKFIFSMTQTPATTQRGVVYATDESDNFETRTFEGLVGFSLVAMTDTEDVTFQFSWNFEAHATLDSTIEVQWAQQVSSGNVTTLIESSQLEIIELGPA